MRTQKKALIILSLAILLTLTGCSENPSMVKKIKELKAEQIKTDKEKPTKKTEEKVIKKATNKEELLETAREGTDKFFAMISSYDYDSDLITFDDKEGSNYSYAIANEEFSSYEKIESYLSPYWSKKTIDYLFTTVGKTVDGVVYFRYGDIGEMEDLHDVSSLELRDSANFKILRIESPFYDDEDIVSEFIFTYERGRWVIDAVNYSGFNSITDDIELKFEARKKELLGKSNYEKN